MAEDITIEMLEGAAYRIYVTLRDEAKALLDTALYDVYGGMSNGKDKVIADVEPCGQGRVLVTLPPGAYSGHSWQYQVCVREKSTGYEWLAVQGEADVLERVLPAGDACVSPPGADVTAVLSPQQLQCEATLVAWNGEVLAGGGDGVAAPVTADDVRELITESLTVRSVAEESLGNPSSAGAALYGACTVQLDAVRGGTLHGVRLPACSGGTSGAARLLRVQIQAADGTWADAASSAATPAQEVWEDCDFTLAVPLVLPAGAAVRLLWADTSGAPAEVVLPVLADTAADALVEDTAGTFLQATPCLSLLWQLQQEKYTPAPRKKTVWRVCLCGTGMGDAYYASLSAVTESGVAWRFVRESCVQNTACPGLETAFGTLTAAAPVSYGELQRSLVTEVVRVTPADAGSLAYYCPAGVHLLDD